MQIEKVEKKLGKIVSMQDFLDEINNYRKEENLSLLLPGVYSSWGYWKEESDIENFSMDEELFSKAVQLARSFSQKAEKFNLLMSSEADVRFFPFVSVVPTPSKDIEEDFRCSVGIPKEIEFFAHESHDTEELFFLDFDEEDELEDLFEEEEIDGFYSLSKEMHKSLGKCYQISFADEDLVVLPEFFVGKMAPNLFVGLFTYKVWT